MHTDETRIGKTAAWASAAVRGNFVGKIREGFAPQSARRFLRTIHLAIAAGVLLVLGSALARRTMRRQP